MKNTQGKRGVYFVTRNVTVSENFESDSGGNMFINKGTSIATVLNIPLQPGEFVVLGVAWDEIDTTGYLIKFTPPGVNNLFVVQKYYR